MPLVRHSGRCPFFCGSGKRAAEQEVQLVAEHCTQRRTVLGLHGGCLQELGRPLSLHQALECSALLTQARRPAPVRCRDTRRPERRSPSRPGAADTARSGSCSPPLALPPHQIRASDEQAGSSDTTHGGGDGKRRCQSFHRLGVAGLAIRMALGHELTRRSERSASLEAANTDGSSTS